MNRAVFDTNVLVSGFLSPLGPPGRIVEWLRNGRLQAVLDDRISTEYREVLLRPRFQLPAEEVDLVLAAIGAKALWVEAASGELLRGLPDQDDAPFLECARIARVPLVTGNRRHFPKSIARDLIVVSPAQFVASLASSFS
jgi:uncharacterized protein